MFICLLLLAALLPHLSCSAPGPLSADRDAAEFFGPSEDNLIVVDAVLIVDPAGVVPSTKGTLTA